MNETESILAPAPLTPDTPGLSRAARFWRFPVTRIVLYILVFILTALVLSLATKGLMALFHFHTKQHPAMAAVLGEGMAAISALLAFLVMTRFVDKRPWATAGFNAREMSPQILAGFALGALLLSVGVGALTLLGVYHVTGHGPLAAALPSLAVYLCVAVFEETLFRGYLFQTLETRWGSGVALVASSLLFGLAHLVNSVHGVTSLERIAGPLFICLEAGLPLGAAYLLTRRWWLPIGIHWAWDFFEGPIYGLHDSGTTDPHTLLHSQVTGPFLAAGGPFGPEAGLALLTAGTLLGLLLLRLAVKNGQWHPRTSPPHPHDGQIRHAD